MRIFTTLAATAVLLSSAAADSYFRLPGSRVLVTEPHGAGGISPDHVDVSVALATGVLPDAIVNQEWTYPFADLATSTGTSKEFLSWATAATSPQKVPTGLAIDPKSGVLSGAPLEEGVFSFEVTASYQDVEKGRQVYEIVVNGLRLEVTAISAGGYHTCAITTAGGAVCWGLNGSGQLGNEDTSGVQPTPVAVEGLDAGVTAISAGTLHTCAIVSGAAWCWGNDNHGRLGNGGAVETQFTPSPVQGLGTGVTAISAGNMHTCAIAGGAGWCWGADGFGQQGNGEVTGAQHSPHPVVGLTSGVTAITAGHAHTCAVVDGGAQCWGNDSHGQLGNGPVLAETQHSPVLVEDLASDVTHVSARSSHTCAVSSGAAYCWGKDDWGQLGNGDISDNQHSPGIVGGLTSGVTAMSVGAEFACAIVEGGAQCWGNDASGQLGNGDTNTERQSSPVQVVGLTSKVATISAGPSHACVVMESGIAKCWGNNFNGELGNGFENEVRHAPVDVKD